MKTKFSALEIRSLKISVAKIWNAVQRKQYDARSLVGDECLSMKEILFDDDNAEINDLLEKIVAQEMQRRA